MPIKSKFVFDPVKKILDKVNIFSSEKPLEPKSFSSATEQQFPRPEKTQKIGRARPTTGDTTQGLGQRSSGSQGVVREQVSYNPKSGEVQVGKQYGPTGKTPPEAVYHGPAEDVSTQKLGQKSVTSARSTGDTTQVMPKRPISGDVTQKIKSQEPLSGDKTQGLGEKASSRQHGVIKEKISYDPKSGKADVVRHYGPKGEKPEVVQHGAEKDIGTRKIGRSKPISGDKTKIVGRTLPEPPISPTSQEGMERIAQRLPDVRKEARAIERRLKLSKLWNKAKPYVKGIGIASLVGMAVGIIGFAVFEYVSDKVTEKVGYTDLSFLLPSANPGRTIWLSAPFYRFEREKAPYFEPNVFEEKITISNNYDGIYALGVSLEGLPEKFSSDINVNGTGEGESDWICAPTGGYLICASATGNPIMETGKNTVVSLFFHLPAIELKKYLQTKNGSRQVYLLMPKSK